MKKAKRKKVKPRRKVLELELPAEVLEFYREVSAVSGVGLNDVINVVLAIRAIKLVDAV